MRNQKNKDENDAFVELSARIRLWRAQRGLSQAELAKKANFARSTLSKIENRQLSPTFEILLKIAAGFDVEITELLKPSNKAPLSGRMSIGRAGDGMPMIDKNTTLLPLASQMKNSNFESFIVEFTQTSLDDFGPWNQHETEDMLYVLSGILEFHSEGYKTVTLHPGDSIHFDGNMAHACLANGTEICRCLFVFATNR